MKRLIVILFIFYPLLSYSQKWIWSDQLECAGNVSPVDVITDNQNNIYLTGTYANSALTIGTESINNSGGTDCFIAKFNTLGELQWLNSIGGNSDDESTTLLIVGNTLYIAGNFKSGTLYFTTTDSLLNEDNWDTFYASYDLNGNFLNSVKIFSGSDVERMKDMIYVASLNSFIIVSQFKTELKYTDNFGPQTIPAKSSKDLFIAVSSLSGIIQDTAIYTTSPQNSILKDINPSPDNGYYLTGDLFGTVGFDATNSITGSSTSTSDVLILKIDQNLNFQWARRGGALNYDHGNNSISDVYGNVFITGKIENDVTFDSTATLQSNIIPKIGAQDLYLAKYNKQGTLQWVKRKGDMGNDDGFGLARRETLIQFCGNISGEVIFNNDTLRSSGISDINTGFAIFNTNGKEIGAQGIGGTGLDIGQTIAFDKISRTIIAGYFSSTSIAIGDSSYSNSTGTSNGFIASYYYPMNAVFTRIDQIKCSGNTNGRLIVTPYFGVGPYSFNWSHDAGLNDSTASNLSSGNYSVTITDSRDSAAFSQITLTEPTPISIASVLSNVSCHPSNGTSNNGSINITASGGTGPGTYSYEWEAISGSGINPANEDQVNLSMGEYSVTITDKNFCAENDTFLISQPNKISFYPSSITNITIPPGGNGGINLNASEGTPPYIYSWAGPGGFNSTNEDISGLLLGGTYSLQLTDADTCVGDTNFVVLSDTMMIAFISNQTDVLCKDDNTGAATVDVTGSLSLFFTYNWSNGGNTQTISDLVDGTYYVTVTEGSAPFRSATSSVKINEPLVQLTSTINPTHLTCYQNNSGIADLTVSGGTLPYTYNWLGGGTTEDQINLPSGPQSVTVTDNNGCTSVSGVTLTEPSASSIGISVDYNILCYGYLTGVLTAEATGGTGIYSYEWDDPGNQTLPTATNLGGGIYNVTATDQAGCTVIGSRQLIEPAEIIATPVPQDISCAGEEDGIITLTYTGGVPSFSFAWSNGAIDQNIQNLTAGLYTVTITDGNNCSDTASAVIIEPDTISFQSVMITNVSCFESSDGSITVLGSGGSGALEYSSDGGSSYSTSGTFNALTAQNYIFRIRDANDCESADSIVTVSQPAEITYQSITITNASCFESSDGSITVLGSGENEPFEYSSDGGSSYTTSGIFSDISAQNYTLRIRDANDCESADSIVSVTQPEGTTIESEETTDISCNGEQDGEITIVASNPVGGLTFSIDDGQNFEDNGGIFTGLASGDYQISIMDLDGCTQSGSALSLSEPTPIELDTNITHAIDDQPGSVEMTASGGSSPYIYVLLSEADSSSNGSGTFNNLFAGDYGGYAIDDNKCESETLAITIEQLGGSSTKIQVYDAFSPNSDGINDLWNIPNIEQYPNCKVIIFNTWGNKVFTSDGYSEPWDGKYNGNDLPAGTYYYTIDPGDGSEIITGPVSIVQ